MRKRLVRSSGGVLALVFVLVFALGTSSAAAEMTLTWLAPVEVSARDAGASKPQVALDPGGNATTAFTWGDTVEASTRFALGPWRTPLALALPGVYADNARVAVDSKGNATVIWEKQMRWEDDEGLGVRDLIIRSSVKPAGGDWSVPRPVSGPHSDGPQLTVSSDGTVTAAWMKVVLSENHTVPSYQVASRMAGAVRWSAAETIYTKPVEWVEEDELWLGTKPQIAGNGRGEQAVAWQEAPGVLKVIRRTAAGAWQAQPDSISWGKPTDGCESGDEECLYQNWFTNLHRSLKIGMDEQGGVTVAWDARDELGYCVKGVSMDAAGNWGPVQTLARNAYGVDLAVDPKGNATAVWQQDDAGGFTSVHTSTRPASGEWGQAQTLAERANGPALSVDTAGNVRAVWEEGRVGGVTVRASARAARGAWTSPVDLLPQLARDVDGLDIALDEKGGATAVWVNQSGTHAVVQSAQTGNPPPESSRDAPHSAKREPARKAKLSKLRFKVIRAGRRRSLKVSFNLSAADKVRVTVTKRQRIARRGKRSRTVQRTALTRTVKAKAGRNSFTFKHFRAHGKLQGSAKVVGSKSQTRRAFRG